MSAILALEEGTPEWTPETFFQSGVDYCRFLMETLLDPRGLPTGREGALDFGCGMGRLTNGLSGYFDEVVGVDISSEMVRLATESKKSSKVRFVHNTRDHLRVFDDASFDLVLSVIVLQHIPPAASLNYISEFLRILKPGGVAVFQLPVRDVFEDRGLAHNLWNEFRRIVYRPKRILEVRRRLPWALGAIPRMEMRGIPKEELIRHISDCHGRLIAAIDDFSAGEGIESYLYLVSPSAS
jgi:SAM-dependent methyltransferase